MLGVLGSENNLLIKNDSIKSTLGDVLQGMTAYREFKADARKTHQSLVSFGQSLNQLGSQDFMSLEQLEELGRTMDEIQESAQQANDLYEAATNLNDKVAQIERVKTMAQAREEQKKAQEALDKLLAEINRKMQAHQRNLDYMDFHAPVTKVEMPKLNMSGMTEKEINKKMVTSFSLAVDKAMSRNTASNRQMVNTVMKVSDYMLAVIITVILAFHIINAKEGFEVIRLVKSVFSTMLIYAVLKVFLGVML